MRLNMPMVTGCMAVAVIVVLLRKSLNSSPKGDVKAAVLGDSYVWEMNYLYANDSGKKDIKARYFGKGGVKITEIVENEIYEETVLYKPDIVVILAGSNDLDSDSDLDVIKTSVNELITSLCMDVIKLQGVYFVEPVLRTKVRNLDSADTYESRRLILEKHLEGLGLMIPFDGMREGEMREDGVHGNQKGMERLRGTIMQRVLQGRDVKQCDGWKEKISNA